LIYVLRDYTPEDIMRILEKAGFSTQIFSEQESGIRMDQGECIILVRKVAAKGGIEQ
jgi:hypothetical protein